MSGHLARSGSRTLIGLLAALGLVAALAMPAFAGEEPEHPLVDPDVIEDAANKTCGELGSYDFEFKVDKGSPSGSYDEDDADVVVTPDVETDFEVTITPGADNTMAFTANYAVEAVYVKGGPIGGNLYEYDPATLSDSGLQTPGGHAISHVSFCFSEEPDPTPTPTPTEEPSAEETASPAPTEEPTEQPTQQPTEEETASPTATVGEGVLGGNPTATPSGGSLPDTAMGEWGQVPATVLSLFLLGSLAAMVYVRLARQR